MSCPIFSALAGAERVFQVMDEAPETADAADAVVLNPCKGHVELKDVTFGYVPGHTILKHISLYAKPGQKIAFVGSTGAGKTTITNLINRFYEIDSGEILMDGVDIRKVGRENLRSNIAMRPMQRSSRRQKWPAHIPLSCVWKTDMIR